MDNKRENELNIDDPLQLMNNRYEEIVLALNLCQEKNLVLPTLMILFTAIDSAGHLYSNNKSVRKRFIEWVDKWMIGDNKQSFSSIDLYSARCGILHTLTANSSLVDERKAKKGIYIYKDATEDETINALGKEILTEYFVVKIEDLIKLFYKGFLNFFDTILKDPILRNNVTQKCTCYYSHTTADEVLEKLNPKTV